MRTAAIGPLRALSDGERARPDTRWGFFCRTVHAIVGANGDLRGEPPRPSPPQTEKKNDRA